MNIRIDTGDSKSYSMSMVMKTAKMLTGKRGCDIVKPIADRQSRFCYEMTSAEGLRFYLVSRSTNPFGEHRIVSVQAELHRKALEGNTPIVMWWPGGFRVFDARVIEAGNVGYNMRLGTRFINFRDELGVLWPEDTPLRLTWQKAIDKPALSSSMRGQRKLNSF